MAMKVSLDITIKLDEEQLVVLGAIMADAFSKPNKTMVLKKKAKKKAKM